MCSFVNAQDKGKWAKVEEMHAHKWQYLVEQSNMTQNEIQKIQPVFMEYETAIWKLHARNREFFRSARNKDKDEKPNFVELNDRYADFELIKAQEFKAYHIKLRKLLSPETLYKYYKAEREYKRKLLQDYPGRPGPGKRN
jgi:ribosomal protein L24